LTVNVHFPTLGLNFCLPSYIQACKTVLDRSLPNVFLSALVGCPCWEQQNIPLHGSMWRWKAGNCAEDGKSSLSFLIAEGPFHPLVLDPNQALGEDTLIML